MKIICKHLVLLFCLAITNPSFSDDEMGLSELLIKNRLPAHLGNIKVRIYPIGTFFRSGTQINEYYQYTAFAQIGDYQGLNKFITGGEKTLTPYVPGTPFNRDHVFRIDQDGVSSSGGCDITVGYGVYQVDIMYNNLGSDWQIIKSFSIDWSDSDYPIHNYVNGFHADIKVYVLGLNDIKIHYTGGNTEPYQNHLYDFHDLSIFNNQIKIWYQYHKDQNGNVLIFSKTPNKNNFRTTDTLNNMFLNNWPVKGIEFLNPNAPSIHYNPGILNVNLEIQNNHYAKINTSTPFIIEDSAKLILKYSEVFENNARLYVQDSGRFFVRPSGELEIDKYGNVIIESGGRAILEQNSNVFFHERGEIIVKNGGSLVNCGADFTNNNYACILVESGGYYGPGIECNTVVTHTVNNGAFIVVDGGTMNIGDNSKIIFDGSTSFLKINPYSSIKLGENAGIEFKNGARLIADGGSFSGIDSSKLWSGIFLDNSGADTVLNCTFRHAKTGLRFTNNAQSNYNDRIIKNCNFYIPGGGNHRGIFAENCYRASIENNVFNMPVSGSYNFTGLFLNNFTIGGGVEAAASGMDDETPYIINIINNTFNNGSASFLATNYTTNFIPFNIYRNTFNYASSVNMFLLKASGSVKNNNFTSMAVPNAIHMFNSNPDFYNNVIASNGVSLQLSGYSYPNMQPLRTSGNLIWKGGKNALSSFNSDNVHLNYSGNLFTDYGHNSFLTSDENYHIYGWIDSSVYRYFTRENCWYTTGAPVISLTRKGDSTSVPFTYYNNGYDCNTSISPTGIEINDVGYGITDTTIISSDNTGTSLNEDDILYAQAEEYLTNKQYYDAIVNFKALIDNHHTSKYLETSLYDLYSCYNGLDTSVSQTYRDDLYSNLQIYLEAKINSGLYSTSFNDIAFDDILMCLTITENYESAMNGYEMIACFNPNPDIRLTASWNYTEIEAILNSGTGGGGRQLEISKELLEFNELKRINKIVSDNPILSKMKKYYEISESNKIKETNNKLSSERKTEYDKYNRSETVINKKLQNVYSSDRDAVIKKNNKARRNILELKYLNKEELENRRIEDLVLIIDQGKIINSNNLNFNTPGKYTLSQNYPNPFNPSTNINYEIPNSGHIKIKIFDISGKEIATLVNEFKQPGRYSVTFDGSDFPSGVYFYRMDLGNSVNEKGSNFEIKKMILIK